MLNTDQQPMICVEQHPDEKPHPWTGERREEAAMWR